MTELSETLTEPGEAEFEVLLERLTEFNRRQMPPWRKFGFSIVLRDPDGEIAAGAHAKINLGMAEIRTVWVDERLRGSGLGRRVMAAIEAAARNRGAARACLDTYGFQAKGFYERLGYRVFGSLAWPGGLEKFWLTKDL